MNRASLDALLAATWPPVFTQSLGPWTIRDGGGGGKRVSAASTLTDVSEQDIDRAERAMDDAGQQALFSVFAGQDDLDLRLSDRTYLCLDPTMLYQASAGQLADLPQGAFTTKAHGSPPEDAREIWHAGGIGSGRIAIMDRAAAPKSVLLTRNDAVPVATAFVAIHDGIAMLHALETAKVHRRQGAGRATMGAAARWALENGAERLALLVTRANGPANALYRDLGLAAQPCYHYRIRP